MSAPLNMPFIFVLTEAREFDKIHRRAGRDARPTEVSVHADAHKYCPLGRCGTRPGPFATEPSRPKGRSAKITAWRIAKAKANRAYLEERVYARTEKPTQA